jgi:2-methylaconitate cis-trans-isomerase PrpF
VHNTSIVPNNALYSTKIWADHDGMDFTVRCVLMRAGTSRGPFFLREWLPADDDARDEALIGAIGASDPLQLDGVGGGSTLTSKVAIVSRSQQPGCDVDYLFAQVGVGQKSIDTRPNCGNMLSGVGPFAIEQGLVQARDGRPPCVSSTSIPAQGSMSPC